MNISYSIMSFLYIPNVNNFWVARIAEFDYHWEKVQCGAFTRIAEKQEDVIFLLARNKALDDERVE